jgi:hypothetical protein
MSCERATSGRRVASQYIHAIVDVLSSAGRAERRVHRDDNTLLMI